MTRPHTGGPRCQHIEHDHSAIPPEKIECDTLAVGKYDTVTGEQYLCDQHATNATFKLKHWGEDGLSFHPPDCDCE
jgi:hypothetical protein